VSSDQADHCADDSFADRLIPCHLSLFNRPPCWAVAISGFEAEAFHQVFGHRHGIVDRLEKALSARREQRNPRLREKNLQDLRAGGGFTGRKKSGQTGNYLLTEEKLGGLKWREMG
jgi:hypothetical protein